MFTKILLDIFFLFLATRIFVTTLDDYWKCAVTGILSLRKNVTQGAIKSTHKTVWPVLTSMGKFGFGVKCNQPVICSSGYSVYECNTNLYIEMESLNVGRKFCGIRGIFDHEQFFQI